MSKQAAREAALIRKIRSLPPEKVAQIEAFLEFLAQRDDRHLTQAAVRLPDKVFRNVLGQSRRCRLRPAIASATPERVPFRFTNQSDSSGALSSSALPMTADSSSPIPGSRWRCAEAGTFRGLRRLPHCSLRPPGRRQPRPHGHRP